ncbi:MAG TPA: FtsX-like permease family protein, partial [Terriglobales bacterium]|nr:FtsX-like permease family protein [Terriglobales bacterium]
TKALLGIGARFIPGPLLGDISVDSRVLAFAIAASLFTAVLFGIAPAWQATRVDLQQALKQGGSHGVLGAGSSRLRNSLVVAQISLSLTLAIGASLLFRTLLALHDVQLGYRTDGILVVSASAPARTLSQALQASRFFDELNAKLRQLPGVISAGSAMGLPVGQYDSNGSYAVEGKQNFTENFRNLPYAGFRLASPGYFTTMGIPLLRGRDFNEGDFYDRPFVLIVSESLVRQVFPNEDPIGHRIRCGLDSPNWMTIVGVVGDVRQSSPAAQPGPELYMPIQQHPLPATARQIVIRTPGNPEALVPAVESTTHEMNPEVATKFTTMTNLVSDSIAAQRFRTVLTSTFALLALLLALSGMYAVMTYITARRTAEFGLRSAVGAQRRNIVALVLRGAATVAATGVIAGILLSILAARVLSAMLFEVKSTDFATYVVVSAMVLPIIVLAAALPAWQASRVDPLIALRSE